MGSFESFSSLFSGDGLCNENKFRHGDQYHFDERIIY
jgi:hypothetical protein